MDTIDSFKGDYYFLSNMAYVGVVFDGVVYSSTEAAYQAAKTLDANERLTIQQANS